MSDGDDECAIRRESTDKTIGETSEKTPPVLAVIDRPSLRELLNSVQTVLDLIKKLFPESAHLIFVVRRGRPQFLGGIDVKDYISHRRRSRASFRTSSAGLVTDAPALISRSRR